MANPFQTIDDSHLDVTERIQSLLDKAYAIRGSFIENSIAMAEEALDLSRKAGAQKCISRSLSVLSLCYMVTGRYDESMDCAEESINIYEELGDDKGVADAKYNIAGIYYKTDNPNIGLIFLKECLFTYEKYDDYHNIARVYKSMGTIYEYFGDEKSAILAYEQSIEAGISAGDPNLESNAYNPLSGIYLNADQIDKALELILKSISMKEQTGDIRGLGFALYGRGKVYLKMKKFAQAEEDFSKAMEIHKKAEDPLGISMTQNKLAALYIETDRHDQAKVIIREMLKRFESGKKVKLISLRSYYMLYQIAKKEGNHEEALTCLEKHYEEKETVINSKTLKVIESYEMINRLKLLESEANTQREKAEIIQKKNLELDSFFYRISHDLKDPITAMKRLDFMMREDGDSKSRIEYADEFKLQVGVIEQILDELLKISRVNHQSEIQESIDFDKLIGDSISSYKHLSNFENLSFEVEVEEGISYHAEWALVNAIVQNLIENSIRFSDLTKKDPFVKIAAKSEAKSVTLTVIDNGTGIDEEQMKQLQDMFYRPQKHIKNSGMGLFILYRAVQNLRAKVDFSSIPREGTTFSVKFPVK